MIFKQFMINVVAYAIVGLLLEQTMVEGCRCVFPGLYESFDSADVVMHATALNRTERLDSDNRYTYTLGTIAVYKEEPNVTYAKEVSFTTRDGFLLCGVTLELGEDYLIGLYGTNGDYTAYTCGLVWEWSLVSDEDEESLKGGCVDDPCDEMCGEFQECLYYAETFLQGEYYCADVCDPSPCERGEVCTLENVQCENEPCPRISNCTASAL